MDVLAAPKVVAEGRNYEFLFIIFKVGLTKKGSTVAILLFRLALPIGSSKRVILLTFSSICRLIVCLLRALLGLLVSEYIVL